MAQNIEHIRHSLAHLLAAAVLKLYPDAKPTLGPAIDTGFYYDFQFPTPLSEEGLPRIEAEMKKILPTWDGFTHREVSADEARELFKGNEFKREMIDELEKAGEPITLYTSGEFTDLCRGGHAKNPAKDIDPDSFKLDKLAGAYWRGDEKNPQLTRIYGLAFTSKKELDEYLAMMEESKKRDHRKLGKELKLFTFSDLVGPGLPLWLPHGAVIAEELESLAKETEFRAGYLRVKTPHIAKEIMYKTSGHLPYYAETMFPPMELSEGERTETYYLKAMNCPHHHQIYASEPRSYRDLPLRLAEYGECYRYEKSGELFGLMRVRSLSMNDAHIYCTSEQFADEFRAVNDMYLHYFKLFGLTKYVMRFSTHGTEGLGKKYVNEPKLWVQTEDMVRKVLKESGIKFVEVADEAAFYGPKIDVQVWSSIGREFTIATNQVDFAVPARFGLVYKDTDGSEKTPLCIHRAPLGTHERFIGFLIEHYGGAFPTWLAPVQVSVLPISDKHAEAARVVQKKLMTLDIRAELDDANETIGKKIRRFETMKVPYAIILGDKDIAADVISVRKRGGEDLGQMKLAEFAEHLVQEIINRT